MSALFMLVKAGDSFPFILPFCSILIIIISYKYGIAWGYLVSAVLSAFCIGLTKLGLDAGAAFLNVINFNIAPVIVFGFNKVFKNYKQAFNARLTQAEEAYQSLLNEDTQIKRFNAQLEKDVLEMARLYEITKSMSLSMDFNDIFSVLKNVLEKTFRFDSSRLILVHQEQPQGLTAIDKILSIKSGAQPDIVEPEDFDKAMLAIYAQGEKRPVIKDSFVAAGLFSDSALIGILTASNIAPEQTDRFLIVASQFQLELQKVRLYETVQQLAILDGLTCLFVRRHLLERFQEELRRSLKHKLNLSCLMVDIDFFKDCNDRRGHLAGDVVLKQIADIIKENVREVDFAGRYGGEEFCIILPDTSKDGAVHVAERLRSAVEAHVFKAYDENIKVTVSIGVTVFPDDGADLNQLIDYADQAMYKAKAEGRNKVRAWQ